MSKRNRRNLAPVQPIDQVAAQVAEQPDEQDQIPLVAPRPLPTQITVTQYTEPQDNSEWVEIIFSTFSGMHVVFLPPDIAEKVAANLIHHATQIKTGLILPATPEVTVPELIKP